MYVHAANTHTPCTRPLVPMLAATVRGVVDLPCITVKRAQHACVPHMAADAGAAGGHTTPQPVCWRGPARQSRASALESWRGRGIEFSAGGPNSRTSGLLQPYATSKWLTSVTLARLTRQTGHHACDVTADPGRGPLSPWRVSVRSAWRCFGVCVCALPRLAAPLCARPRAGRRVVGKPLGRPS